MSNPQEKSDPSSDGGGNALTIGEVIAGYLRDCEGDAPVRQADYLQKYPQFRDSLSQFFRDHHQMAQLANPVREINSEFGGSRTLPIKWLGDYQLLEEIGRGGAFRRFGRM